MTNASNRRPVIKCANERQVIEPNGYGQFAHPGVLPVGRVHAKGLAAHAFAMLDWEETHHILACLAKDQLQGRALASRYTNSQRGKAPPSIAYRPVRP